MKLLLTSIAHRRGNGPAQALLAEYTARLATYMPAAVELHRNEEAFLGSLAKYRTRTAPLLVLLHSEGQQFSSEALAQLLRTEQDIGRQLAIFAVGSADGWSESALALAQGSSCLLWSLGLMTLPHELARIVLAEQLYRACTILAGHPYHSGH